MLSPHGPAMGLKSDGAPCPGCPPRRVLSCAPQHTAPATGQTARRTTGGHPSHPPVVATRSPSGRVIPGPSRRGRSFRARARLAVYIISSEKIRFSDFFCLYIQIFLQRRPGARPMTRLGRASSGRLARACMRWSGSCAPRRCNPLVIVGGAWRVAVGEFEVGACEGSAQP